MNKEEFLDKCVAFSIKINKLRKFLLETQREYNNSDQIQRSGTSIGANYSEACNAVSKADFINKLSIAQKEAHETIYWLRVLHGSEFISKEQFDDLMADVLSLHKMLSASIATMKSSDEENKI